MVCSFLQLFRETTLLSFLVQLFINVVIKSNNSFWEILSSNCETLGELGNRVRLLEQVWTPYAWSDRSEDIWIFSPSTEFKDTQYLSQNICFQSKQQILDKLQRVWSSESLKTLKHTNLKGESAPQNQIQPNAHT